LGLALRTLPLTLPSAYVLNPGQSAVPADVDVGGYDVMIGGHGFRLATDQQFYYSRATEPTTTHRFDSELEPGEQSLSPLPWIKSQSSFHGGAGQQNLEQGLTSFEYQQEKIDHIRFDTSLGVDPWTIGKVSRLPDCRLYNYGFSATCSVTATVGGIDYAILGGAGGLFQAAWTSGPDADPVVTRISLVNSTYVGDSNVTITSLTTDGSNYYGVAQLTTVGYNPNILTYVIAGAVNSTSTPEAIYRVPNLLQGAAYHNLCTNPSFENNTTGWHTFYQNSTATLSVDDAVFAGTLTRSATRQFVGADSGKYVAKGGAHSSRLNVTFGEGVIYQIPSVLANTTYTVSCYVYVEPGSTAQQIVVSTNGIAYLNGFGSATTATGTWQRVEATFTTGALGTSFYVGVGNVDGTTSVAGDTFYVDALKIEQSSWSSISYFDGDTTDTSTYNYTWDGTAGNSASTATPLVTVAQTPSIVGWQKARLVGLLGRSLYELDPNAPVHSDLPTTARYTNPSPGWTWTAIAESPTGILAAGYAGNQASILDFTLDVSGGTPFLSGGSSVAQLPVGEKINMMEPVLGSWLALATSEGIRVGTFDTYTGNLKVGPLSVTTNSSCLDVASRDRFVYGGYTNQQADGKTGLVRVDLTMLVDVAGRMAYAPDLRPPTTAPTGLGAVNSVNVLPLSGRMVWITPEGIHVEGNGPGTDGSAWIRTSRIRFNTAEMKLFKLGRLHGSLDVGNITITGISPFGVTDNLGTFGFDLDGDPGEFRLPGGLNEWIQLQFSLDGSTSALNSYQVKAYPAPARQHVYTITVNCFRNETDRFGLDVTDPETPRQRLQNLVDLEETGNEIRYVEFTNEGSVAQLVLIDQLEFRSFSRPNIEDDFGGYITLRLRTTEH